MKDRPVASCFMDLQTLDRLVLTATDTIRLSEAVCMMWPNASDPEQAPQSLMLGSVSISFLGYSLQNPFDGVDLLMERVAGMCWKSQVVHRCPCTLCMDLGFTTSHTQDPRPGRRDAIPASRTLFDTRASHRSEFKTECFVFVHCICLPVELTCLDEGDEPSSSQ